MLTRCICVGRYANADWSRSGSNPAGICIFATPRERELMAATGAHLSTSPLTELRTLLGFPQLSEMLDAGVLTSLSVDTSALSANADMFQTMRVALDVEHVRAQSDVSLSPRRVLELATIDGARDLGLAAQERA